MKQLGVVAVALAGIVGAADLPWDGTKLVFGEDQRDGTFTLDEPAAASEVVFDAPAVLKGETLTLTSPALVKGTGSLLTPLAGTDGLTTGAFVECPEFFAQPEYQTVWKNINLADVTGVTGNFCGTWAGAVLGPAICVAFKRLDTETPSVTLQLQTVYQPASGAHWVRCFKLQFEQDGNDVKAKALWCKYASYPTKAHYYGQDWDNTPGISPDGYYLTTDFSKSIKGEGSDIGVTNIRPVIPDELVLEGSLPTGGVEFNNKRIEFNPSASRNISTNFTGIVTDIVFRSNKTAEQEYHNSGWVQKEEVLVATNTSVQSVRFKSAIMVGNWVEVRDPALFDSYTEVSEDGSVMTMQVQCFDYKSQSDIHTKAVFLEFRQAGKDVYMKAVGIGSMGGDVRGQSVIRTGDQVVTEGNPENKNSCNGGYGLYGLKLVAHENCWPMKLTGVKDKLPTDTVYTFDQIDISGDNANRFSDASHVVLTNGSYMKKFPFGDVKSLTLHDGCKVDVSLVYTMASSGSDVNVHGGTIRFFYHNYVNRLTLSNGGRALGKQIRVGAFNLVNFTATLAGSPCYIQSIYGAKQSEAAASNWHEFRLAGDLYIGGLFDVPEQWVGLRWAKMGAADLYINGVSETIGPFRIDEGSLVLDCDGALSKTNEIILAGGAVDGGAFTNRLGVLSLNADSVLVAGTGSLSFSDSSAAEWVEDAKLSITGATSRLSAGHIRFMRENGAAGLSAAQLNAMRYNGVMRVAIDSDGWLESYFPGMSVTIR